MPKTGDINVTLYRGDRRLWTGGDVRLVVLDPFSDTEKILVDRHISSPTVILDEVPADRGQNYSILASGSDHRDAGIYPVKPKAGGVSHTALMLVRKDPEPDFSQFSFEKLNEFSPTFRQSLEAANMTEESFRDLGPARIAGALNIEAKLRNTNLMGRPAVEFVKKVGSPEGGESIRQDRIFAWVDKTMPDQVQRETEQNGTFARLSEAFNEGFHRGYPVSFKQQVPFGSLQLSFARTPGEDDLLAADIDIDLFTDVGHFGEVLRNKLTQQKTDPYTVYVQLFDQRIFPLYVIKA